VFKSLHLRVEIYAIILTAIEHYSNPTLRGSQHCWENLCTQKNWVQTSYKGRLRCRASFSRPYGTRAAVFPIAPALKCRATIIASLPGRLGRRFRRATE